MATYKFGFIGTGNMGSAIARAVCRAVSPDEIALSNRTSSKAEVLAYELKCTATDSITVAREAKFIFLGVKPQGLKALFDSISPFLATRHDHFVLISMAAGISINQIQTYCGSEYPVIRIMPNTPTAVGEGMTVYSVSDNVFEDDLSEFCAAMKYSGILDRIDESLIDAACAVSGCGPAFVYMFAEALADAGVKNGLSRAKALKYAAQTVLGSAKMVLNTGKHPAQLKDEVCSPAGSTIAGVKELENGAFRATVMNAVDAAVEKTKNLGK